MLRTHGLSHIQLAVRDVERSARFYRELFGMEELFRLSDTCRMLQTPGSNEVFTLNQHDDGDEPGAMGAIAHFGFRLSEPRDMAEVMKLVADAGGTPINHGTRGKGETWLFATDPDGYEIELFWMP